MKKIPIFFTFNNNYVEPAAVAFYSLLNKAREGVVYDMYVLHSDITDEKQNVLFRVVEQFNNGNLTFVNTEGFLDEYWDSKNFSSNQANSKFTVDTIVRCFAARFFPDLDKIIYSDVDIVVVDDISDIYDIDMGGKYIFGVKNPFLKYSKYELSHLKPAHYEMLKDSYIAGGIWVMNLKQIREDNLEERMLNIVKDETIEKRWNDQDIINIACSGNVGFIPLNHIGYPYMLDLLKRDDFVSHYSRKELFDSVINAKIIHYAAGKPWNNNSKYAELWWTIFEYLKLEKTHIFLVESSPNDEYVVELNKKVRKYKIYFKIVLFISILLFLLNVFF